MKIVPALLIALSILSCKNKPAAPAGGPAAANEAARSGDSTATSAYLPLIDILRQDIRQVDSFAGGILKKTNIQGKKDSAFIKPADFHAAVTGFLAPELETPVFRRSYTENSLMDESTNQIQFIYTANSPNPTVRQAVAYVSPSAGSSNQVNRIYLEKEWKAGDTIFQQKLTWKTRQYCYIITIRQAGTSPALHTIEKFIWDPTQFDQ